MPADTSPPRKQAGNTNHGRLDQVVAKARKDKDARMRGYREQSLRLHPHVCARCGRDFTHANLHELTVHHKDHNHDNNPPDGSNWENLCLYCHDWEHQKYSQLVTGEGASFGVTNAVTAGNPKPAATNNPFAALKDMLDKKK
jgi:5-methylcytosine-specific restriction endonuclease McrA